MSTDFEELSRRKHEESVVKILLKRYRITDEEKFEMIDRYKCKTGRTHLVLSEFLDSYPTFPVHLGTTMIRNLPEKCQVQQMFNNFAGLDLFTAYDNLVECFGDNFRERRAGVVFKWPYVKDRNGDGGNLVIHNYTINVDVPGTRIFWVPQKGRQLVVEQLDVLLESIDRGWRGGLGWQPYEFD